MIFRRSGASGRHCARNFWQRSSCRGWLHLALILTAAGHAGTSAAAYVGTNAGTEAKSAESSPELFPNLSLGTCDHSYKTPGDAECGQLWVAEDPKHADGRKIPLNILRVPAVNQTAGDPLFIIVGGPGGAAVRSANSYMPHFRGVQQKRDIVFVDQRGTGESNGLRCPFDLIPFSRLTNTEKLQRSRAMAADCAAGLDANLEFYTTPYAVQDLEKVRQALAYERVNLWGVSYGTRVALEYMRQFPERVRTSTMDGLAPVAIQLPRFAERDTGRALERIFSQCKADPACFRIYGDLRDGWSRLLQRLEMQPEVITLVHPRSQEAVPTHVSPAVVSSWVRVALYSRELAPLLPQAIQRANNHDFSLFGSIALLAAEQLTHNISQGLQAVVLCAEDYQYPLIGTGGDSLESPLLQLNDAAILAAVCEHFPHGSLSPDYFAPVRSDVPALLLSGEYDPVTPPEWGEQVARTLANSRHLVVAGAHHGVTMQGCMARLVKTFIEVGAVTAIEPECAETIRPSPFFIDGAGPAVVEDAPARGEQSD